MSMELLEGGTLAERLHRGPLAPRVAAELMVKIARAVQYAHDHGVLHRDLKPGNILLDAAGEPRVSDFGLARGVQESTDLTMTGAVLGTPAYMSPEQVAGVSRGLTTATDVWALGAMLYEMLSGRAPFRGESHTEVFRRIIGEEPDRLSEKGLKRQKGPGIPSVPADLSTIVQRCLRKAPAARPPGALYLAEELERWLAGKPILSRPVSRAERLWKWMRRHPARAALAGTAVAALVAISIISTVFSVRIERERVATLHRVARQHTQSALHFMETGDAFRALLSLVEAIAIGSGDEEKDHANRLRFASIVRLGPRLDGLWFASAGAPLRGQFPTSGDCLLITHGRTDARTHGRTDARTHGRTDARTHGAAGGRPGFGTRR